MDEARRNLDSEGYTRQCSSLRIEGRFFVASYTPIYIVFDDDDSRGSWYYVLESAFHMCIYNINVKEWNAAVGASNQVVSLRP